MKNIIFVVGARPNFMKVAPLLKEVLKYSAKFNPILIHTGQHYDFNMSKIFFEQLNISLKPICFNIMSGSQTQQTAEIMIKFEEYLKTSIIDLVIVVGDVNSSLATALVAAKKNIPIAHIEAGLRSFNKEMPEEINRIIIDSLSTLFFTTEPSADENLEIEGHKLHIYRVGNVMIDTLKNNLSLSRKMKSFSKFNLAKKDYIFMTLHRPSNVDNKEKLTSIIQMIDKIAEKHKVLFLIHPRTKNRIVEFDIQTKNIILKEPLGYLESINLMENSKLVITDSGGIQEETTFLGVPCVTLRKDTERPITQSHGTNIIAGEDETLYEQIICESLNKENVVNSIPLWDGNASKRIIKILNDFMEI
jgi:UDP-N-acetylglucosamine 2-epimerase (non-hydrolysing)